MLQYLTANRMLLDLADFFKSLDPQLYNQVRITIAKQAPAAYVVGTMLRRLPVKTMRRPLLPWA